MVCSLKFKKDVNVKNAALNFVILVLKPYPHPSCYLTSIMDKTHNGPVIALFLYSFSSFFSLGRRCPRNQLLIGRYIVAIQQIITHEEHLRHSF